MSNDLSPQPIPTVQQWIRLERHGEGILIVQPSDMNEEFISSDIVRGETEMETMKEALYAAYEYLVDEFNFPDGRRLGLEITFYDKDELPEDLKPIASIESDEDPV